MGSEMVKIYKFCDVDYIAASTIRSAVREWCSTTGNSYREALEEIEEVPDQDLDLLMFFDDIENGDDSPKRTFREQLAKLIEAGEKFPCFFATSEW